MNTLSQADIEKLTALEESLWRAQTRFDQTYMDRVLARDFIEFGRSGRIYTRAEALSVEPQRLDATLTDVAVRAVTADVGLVTYLSRAQYEQVEYANRSSLWVRAGKQWQLKFHQGTPVAAKSHPMEAG